MNELELKYKYVIRRFEMHMMIRYSGWIDAKRKTQTFYDNRTRMCVVRVTVTVIFPETHLHLRLDLERAATQILTGR